MRRHIVTFLFLGLALFLYGLGAAGPATGFLALGFVAECVFWFRLIFGKGKN